MYRKCFHVSLRETKNMLANRAIIPGTRKKIDGKAGLIVMSAMMIPFRNVKAANAINPKFLGISLFSVKDILTKILSIALSIAVAYSSELGMLRKPDSLDA